MHTETREGGVGSGSLAGMVAPRAYMSSAMAWQRSNSLPYRSSNTLGSMGTCGGGSHRASSVSCSHAGAAHAGRWCHLACLYPSVCHGDDALQVGTDAILANGQEPRHLLDCRVHGWQLCPLCHCLGRSGSLAARGVA
jgi:hypothetical protein